MTASNCDITITYHGVDQPDPAVPWQWLRITTDKPPLIDGVTKWQLARMIDSAIGISDPCAKQRPSSTPAEDLGSADCSQSAADLGADGCDPARKDGKPITKRIYVHCSDDAVEGDYVVKATGRASIALSGKRTRKIVRLDVDFSNLDYAPIGYRIDYKRLQNVWRAYPPRWVGQVYIGHRSVDPPSCWMSGDKVVLSQEVTGKLQIVIPIIYDTYAITILGVYHGGKITYNTNIIGFSKFIEKPENLKLSDEEVLDDPESSCESCKDEDDDSGYPDGYPDGTYKLPDGTIVLPDGTLIPPSDQDELDELLAEVDRSAEDHGKESCKEIIGCCKGHTVKYVPECVTPYTGGAKPIDPAVIDDLKNIYGDDIAIIMVLPESGICGKLTTRTVAEDCCDGVEPVHFVEEDSGDIVSPGSSVYVRVEGGVPPYKFSSSCWSVSANDDGNTATVKAPADACGSCDIKVEDSCSSDVLTITSTVGKWILTYQAGVFSYGPEHSIVSRGERCHSYHCGFAEDCPYSACKDYKEVKACKSYPSTYCYPIGIKKYKWGC